MYALWILFRDFKNHILQGKTSYAGTSYPGSTVYGKLIKGLEAAMAYSIYYPDICLDRLRNSLSA
jgi:hypothetical protein